MISTLLYENHILSIAFAALMGLAILLYVILDGYDLGVGMLLQHATAEEKDHMIASIGPFWDANETWLVLGIGVLLVAFPVAHGIILTALYLPTTIMLIALVLRGVSFDFRAKVIAHHKHWWDRAFFAGSLLAALAQGYMLGIYIMGFKWSLTAQLFAALTAICLVAGYMLIGACWLIMKTEGALQAKAIGWARTSLKFTALGIVAISLTTPLVSTRIFNKWFSMPDIILLSFIPFITALIIIVLARLLQRMPLAGDRYCWVPFVASIMTFILCFQGLAYSFYPYIIPERMTIWQATSAPESLLIVLLGVALVLPCIIGYTLFAYRIFWGKVKKLTYY